MSEEQNIEEKQKAEAEAFKEEIPDPPAIEIVPENTASPRAVAF